MIQADDARRLKTNSTCELLFKLELTLLTTSQANMVAAEQQRVREIFRACLSAASSQQRSKVLEQECDGDIVLLRTVSRLLEAHDLNRNFLEEPFCQLTSVSASKYSKMLEFDPEGTLECRTEDSALGSLVGPYKLLEQIGEGGMGTVFMAAQSHPIRRKIALKIIKAGMDTKQVIARFEAERQVLAMMNHPHIAKVLDAGTTSAGNPYFVMELIKGIPITKFCNQQTLDLRQRLVLFQQVCDAVQHAHQKGVIHRDLKPSNILVELQDVKAVAKVIDFGVAKATQQALTENTLYTGFSQLIGTPLYMSPEQAQLNSLDVDVRSDVYSLGVLLYELLTGSTPFDSETLKRAGFDEMRRMIREDEPPRPSSRVSTLENKLASTVSVQRQTDQRQLSLTMKRELDWIVMRALEKDRTRRYESASGLSQDIQRYLDGDFVLACPPSTAYRIRKYVKRRPHLIAAAAPLGIAILVSFALLWNERRQTLAALTQVTSERQLAQEQKLAAELQEKQARANAAEAILQRNDASLNRYYAEIVSGQVDQQLGSISRLQQKLIRHLPILDEEDRRGWEWYYLYSLCHPETRTLFGAKGDSGNASWSPGGAYIASAVIIYDAKTGECVRRLDPSRILTTDGTWSPDGQMYAWGAVEDDNCIYLWERESDRLTELRGHKSSVWCVNWSPDGNQLASGGMDKEVWIWDVATRAPTHKFDAGEFVTDVAWSPNGEMLAAGIKWNDVKVWNPKSGEQLANLEDLGEPGVSYRVRLSWHPNSDQLAVSTPEGWFVVHPSDWTVIQKEARKQAPGYAVAWRPDGKRIAVANNGMISVLNTVVEDNAAPAVYGPTQAVRSITWSLDGQKLMTNEDQGAIKVWDLNSPFQPPVLSVGNPVQSLAWLPDSETIVTVDSLEGSTSFWHATAGVRRKVEPALSDGETYWSPDRRLVACLPNAKSQEIRILNGTTGEVHATWNTDPKDEVGGICWSQDGTKLAIRKGIAKRTSMEVWDVEHEKRISKWMLQGIGSHADVSNEMAWSPDGALIALAAMGETGDDGTAAHQGHVYVVEASRGVTVLKHNLAGWDDRSIVTSLAWHPDNQSFIAGNHSGLIEAVAVASGRTLFRSQLSRTPIRSLAWNPDGSRVVSAAEDGTVKVCATNSGEELLQFQLGESAKQASWSPNGKRLAVVTDRGEIHLWDATRAYEFSESGSRRGELAWTFYQASRQSADANKAARLQQVLKLAADTLGFWEVRGHAYAKLGDFESASQEFAKAIEPGLRTSFTVAEYYGYSLLGAGKPSAYRRHCEALLKAFSDTEVASTGGSVAWLCVLTEDDQLETEPVLRLAQNDANANDENRTTLCLGAALYRNQQYQAAADMLTETADHIESQANTDQHWKLACSQYFLAMARQRLGHDHQARRILADATAFTEILPTATSWIDRVALQVLHQEASALID